MKKEMYERAELEMIRFQTEDIICTTGEDDELPFVPNNPNP